MTKTDWHAGFVPAMKLELLDNEKDLIFEEEHPVDKRGNWIDLLIIKNERSISIKSAVGAIFDRFNVVEYKAPGDSVNLGVFYKVLAYTSLYLKECHDYARFGSGAFTMTIVCYSKPIRMMQQLEADGIICTQTRARGFYEVSGCIPFKAQIIVTSLLPPDCSWLGLLTKKASVDKLNALVDNTVKLRNDKHREYADEVADTFLSANIEYIRNLKEVDFDMCKAIEEIFGEEHRQEIAEKDAQISQKDAEISRMGAKIKNMEKQIAKLQSQIAMM